MPNFLLYDPHRGMIQSIGGPLEPEIYLRDSLSVFSLCDSFGGYHEIINVESVAVSVL